MIIVSDLAHAIATEFELGDSSPHGALCIPLQLLILMLPVLTPGLAMTVEGFALPLTQPIGVVQHDDCIR